MSAGRRRSHIYKPTAIDARWRAFALGIETLLGFFLGAIPLRPVLRTSGLKRYHLPAGPPRQQPLCPRPSMLGAPPTGRGGVAARDARACVSISKNRRRFRQRVLARNKQLSTAKSNLPRHSRL